MNVLVVNPSLPVKSVPELIALAKERPGKLTFASSGFGNSPHLAGELLKSMAAIDILHVPYRDAGAVLPDLMAGRVDFYFGNTSAMLPLAREGKVRALAVTGASRNSVAPELPTVAELGFLGYQATTWIGVIAPVGVPKPIVAKLNREINRALALPDVRKRFIDMGLDVIGSTPEQFTAQIASDIPKKIKIVTDAGIERR